MPNADAQLIAAFASFSESVDRIACFKAVRQRFVEKLPDYLRGKDDDALVWRLFQLRKTGKLIVRRKEN
jgi:hypothetical protein